MKGDINPSIIVQRRKLDEKGIQRLATIIGQKVPTISYSYVAGCFTPHHGIFVYKSGRSSFVELCFSCRALDTSKDFSLDIMDFRNRKWEKLVTFYKDQGMSYKIEEKPADLN